MFFDSLLQFSNVQAITSTAASTNIFDVTGAGSGNAPPLTWGTSTVFGSDLGLGEGAARPTVTLYVGTAFVSGGGATLTVQIQAAIDNGSNVPGTYTTLWETGLLSAATLAAGAQIQLPLPPRLPGEALPRFYRLNYVVATSTFSAGTISAWLALSPTSNATIGAYPNNYTVV